MSDKQQDNSSEKAPPNTRVILSKLEETRALGANTLEQLNTQGGECALRGR